jgi:cytoskeleton protein RodZ
MTDQPLNDPQDSGIAEPGEAVGRRLRSARLERNLSLERIATQLHLKPAQLGALENGRYDDLPGPVFIMGYIRNYARQLNLDPEPLVAAYRGATEGPELPRPHGPRSQDNVKHGRWVGRTLVRLTTVVVVVGLAFLFAQWWQNRVPGTSDLSTGPGADLGIGSIADDQVQDDRAANRAKPEMGLPPADDGSMAEVGGIADTMAPDRDLPVQGASRTSVSAASDQDAVPPREPEPVESAADLATALAPSEAQSEQAGDAASPPTSGEGTVVGADQDEVVLEFRGPCWVDVRDSAKTFRLTGSMAKGDQRVLGGTPPYSLVLGSTKAVTLTVKGVPFDLSRVAKGNVARFKLDPAALP